MTDTDEKPKDTVFYIRCPSHSARKAEIIKLAADADGRSVSAFLLNYGYLAANLVLRRNKKRPKRPKPMPMNKFADALVKEVVAVAFADVLKNKKKKRLTKAQKILVDMNTENR